MIKQDFHSSIEKQKSQIFRHLCNHLVALCILYRSGKEFSNSSELNFFSCSGSIICIRGIYFFLTAGHTLEKIDKILQKGQIRIQNASLVDTFGSNAKFNKPIPFDFINEQRFFINDEGLDFGLIVLRSYYADLLTKNGIIVIFEKNWIHQHEINFENYFMLGLPEEFIQKTIPNSDFEPVVEVKPTLINLKHFDKPPNNIRSSKSPRFVGQLDQKLQLSSIVGMSGGPIFGFYSNYLKYQIVAIQSSWLRDRLITFGFLYLF